MLSAKSKKRKSQGRVDHKFLSGPQVFDPFDANSAQCGSQFDKTSELPISRSPVCVSVFSFYVSKTYFISLHFSASKTQQF